MFILKLLKWIFGIASGALSILLLTYLGMKNEYWAIVDSEGQVVIDKTMGICLIAIWAVIGALYLLFNFLHRKYNKKDDSK